MSRVGFSDFFNGRVGSSEAVEHFDRRLTGYVQGAPNVVGNIQELPDDPYERLRMGLGRGVYGYTPTGVKPGTLEASDIQRQMAAGGVDIIVSALRGAGTLQEMHARDKDGVPMPQYTNTVVGNRREAVRFAMGLATCSQSRAAAMLRGVHKKVEPSSLSNRVVAWFASTAGMPASWGEDLTDAFKAERDEDGQVHLERRYRSVGKMGVWHCPAVDERMPVPPGAPEGSKGEPSLRKYLSVIADVAMREIWSTQFPVVPDRVKSTVDV